MNVAIKAGHIPEKYPLGYYRDIDKSLKIDNTKKDIVLRIFELYLECKSYQTIANEVCNLKCCSTKDKFCLATFKKIDEWIWFAQN